MNTLHGDKYLWRLPDSDTTAALSIAASYNISLSIAQTLVNRGLLEKSKLDSYLFSAFERDVAHPSSMKHAQRTVERIIAAIERKEKILIFGDYDVDGITSSSLMMACLLPLGAQVNFFLPHRVHDGYGLSTKIVERAAKNDYRLIITVDNGITAFEPALRAKELRIDLIITDHHRPHDHLPEAYAVVDPHQSDCAYPYKFFAGVGVAFKLMSFLYELKGLSLPTKAYELLLLGTIADVVPLTGENRFWVRYGLHHANRAESLSFKVLKQNGKITKAHISATDIGYGMTPQINALGRLEDPRQGVKFLLGSDEREVQEVGRILKDLNETRKEIERSIFNQVQEEIIQKRIDIEKENIIIAASDKWPPGVIGLVASRLVGMYGKPTILLHITQQGIAKGSCRSIPEFSMFDALEANKGLLEQFGGHALAAGLSLKVENISKLKEALENRIASLLTPYDLQQKIVLDAQLSLSDVSKKLATDLQLLEPFGSENREPLFYIKDVVQVQKPLLMKDAHVKCMVFADGVIKPLVFFNRPTLFELFMRLGDTPFHAAAHITENHWNGRVSTELLGVDVAIAKESL
ncbi:single-stranded-DNA-specific exonuclease RecJ [Candidatus Dependentiae bacterium]|nr:single-stranded-DNA-specific exonuclease RecJ [Candidatus Dependentiae bacterium]